MYFCAMLFHSVDQDKSLEKNVYLLYFVYIFSVGKAERENFFILNGKTNRKGKLNEKSFLFSGGFY